MALVAANLCSVLGEMRMLQAPEQLTPWLWRVQSKLYNMNSGVFLSGSQACLIDPGIYPEEIAAIGSFVAAQGAMLQAIVLTHCHWDHVLGPEYFKDIKVIAHTDCQPAINDRLGDYVRWQIDDWAKEYNVKRKHAFCFPEPNQVFADTAMLTLGELSLLLEHAPGHERDHIVVYHSGTAALRASDILSDLEIPFICQSLIAYEQTLRKLSSWEISILVPGHGSPSADPTEIRNRFAEDIAYVVELRERVELAIRRGKTVEETVESCTDMNYRCTQDNAPSHLLNVESAYLELGGRGDPRQVGWDKLLYQRG